VYLYLSKDRSARHPRTETLAALEAGLDDSFHVWANVGFGKYEFDWLVFRDRGWFGIYEEKTFDAPVEETADFGDPWILVGGAQIENPGEQVNKHADLFRRFVRGEIIPRFAPTTDARKLSVWCGVYSPHIRNETLIVKPRWGLYYRSLDAFVRDITTLEPNALLALEPSKIGSVVDCLNKKLRARPAERKVGASVLDDRAEGAPAEDKRPRSLHEDKDALTGLPGARYFEETLEREVARAHRYGRRLALVLFDLDSFKALNDKHGHVACDVCPNERRRPHTRSSALDGRAMSRRR